MPEKTISREDLQHLSDHLQRRSDALKGVRIAQKYLEAKTEVQILLAYRPTLSEFGRLAMTVVLGKHSPVVLTLFAEDEELPRYAAHESVAGEIARWLLAKMSA